MNFDITGQKAYIKYGPYRDQLGIVRQNFTGEKVGYTLMIGNDLSIEVELQDLVLVDVDVREFDDWCDRNGYA